MSTTKKTIATTTKRLTELPADVSQKLSSLEENVLRMHHGIGAPERLESMAVTDELAEKLHAIEARAFEMTGRADALRAQKTSPKDKITASLKDKA